MKKRIVLLTAVLAAGLLAGCGSSEETDTSSDTAAVAEDTANEEEPMEEEEAAPYEDFQGDVAYIDDGNPLHTLDIYGAAEKDGPTKTVIEVHGGGFIGGTKETNIDHSIVFADAGYVVVTPEYSKVPADADFKGVVQELFSCYQWVADNAETYNIDTNNIFLSGDSAGGYYILLTNAIMHDQSLQEYFEVTPPSYEFSGYIATCPEADILSLRDGLSEDAQGANAHIAQTIGADILNDEDLMSHMDLFSCVDPSAFTDLYMMTTPGDETTGESVLKFDQYLTENNVPHTLNSYTGTENELIHVFNISHTDYKESIQANQDEINYMEERLK